MAVIWKGFLWKMDWISTSGSYQVRLIGINTLSFCAEDTNSEFQRPLQCRHRSRLTIPTRLIPNHSGRCFSFFKSSPLNFNPIDIVFQSESHLEMLLFRDCPWCRLHLLRRDTVFNNDAAPAFSTVQAREQVKRCNISAISTSFALNLQHQHPRDI